MRTNTIETQETKETEGTPSKRKPTAKKSTQRAKKAGGKSKADRANKKAQVSALLKRVKGAALAEIMATTGWQGHTVRGFVRILGNRGGEKIESSKNRRPTSRVPRRRISFSAACLPGFGSRCFACGSGRRVPTGSRPS
jgi:Protein of unknown function (DUF3489)